MAEFINSLGKIRGKFGNVITYGGFSIIQENRQMP